jgi:transposase-like protein
MAIVAVTPANWEEVGLVQIDSDAPSNAAAVVEIEDWAAEHGMVRTNEYWLRQLNRGNQRLFRGICYRVTEEERASRLERLRRIEERVDAMPVTPHSGTR